MMTTATHNAYDTTTERVLFVALELREKTGSVANFVRRGEAVRARHERVLQGSGNSQGGRRLVRACRAARR